MVFDRARLTHDQPPQTMHASVALLVVLASTAHAQSRAGHEREIDAAVPAIQDFVLNDRYLAMDRNRAKLVTKPRPSEPLVQDNVIVESNVVAIRRAGARPAQLVRRRRGYNLEHVQVPARYPYLPVPGYFTRFRRWGTRPRY